jgi:hypothetical protein
MCSILCWILSIWEALGWKFCIFGLIHALSTRREVWASNGLLDAFRRFSCGFEPFLCSGVHRSDRSRSPVWSVRVLALFICWAPVWSVVVTGLTGQSWADAAALFSSSGLHAFVQGELHWFRGSLPKGSDTCLLQVIVLFAFVWLSIACWRFFLFVSFLFFLFSLVSLCGCCWCTHPGGDWGPCVVRGLMDDRFLVWWVMDNVVCTDS